MKKFWIALGICMLLCALAVFACAEGSTTVMVYMCGSDLVGGAMQDLNEMASAGVGEEVNVIVMLGGATEWNNDTFEDGSVTVFTIKDGTIDFYSNIGPTPMCDPDTLAGFMEYSLTNYPADRQILVLWDHGGGAFGGICVDRTVDPDGKDRLSLVDVNTALASVQESVPDMHLEILGMDACLMGCYEVASMLTQYDIDYFIGSEDTEPGCGWNYTPWLAELENNPGIADDDLCCKIIEAYADGCNEYEESLFSLSAIDLHKMPALIEAMENFSVGMTRTLQEGHASLVRRGRSRMSTFGGRTEDSSSEMVDLGNALNAYTLLSPDEADAAYACLRDVIVSGVCSAASEGRSGMAIMMPDFYLGYLEYLLPTYSLDDLYPNLLTFLKEYEYSIASGSYNFGQTTPETVAQGETITGQDSAQWNASWAESEEALNEAAQSYTLNGNELGFSMQLSEEDLKYLDYVEGVLFWDVSDDELNNYVDMGTMRRNLIDWNTGAVTSLYDGTWTILAEQPVPLFDVADNGHTRRSVVPVMRNGEKTYLVVLFENNGTSGSVLGTSAGYDADGLPVREITKLEPGDVITPYYTCYSTVKNDPDAEQIEVITEGNPIKWEDGITVEYMDLSEYLDETMCFAFRMHTIFGDQEMTDFISFNL